MGMAKRIKELEAEIELLREALELGEQLCARYFAESERLRGEVEHLDEQIQTLLRENERLRGLVREAYRAGFWEWAAPANVVEDDRWTTDEQAAWAEWSKEHMR